MLVSGSVGVQDQGDETYGDAAVQLRLRLKNMCLLGRSFFEAGFIIILDDIIIGDRWQHLQEDLEGVPFSLVVLAPFQESLNGDTKFPAVPGTYNTQRSLVAYGLLKAKARPPAGVTIRMKVSRTP